MNFSWLRLTRPLTYISKIHGTVTIGTKHKAKSLFSGGVTQSGGEIAIMWNNVISRFYKDCTPPKNILILGVGGGSVIHSIRAYDTKVKIIGIEVDPIMKQIATEQFAIKESRNQKIIIADAIAYLFKETQKYDLIIVDLYIGPLNPSKSRTKKFIKQLSITLKKNGTIFYNAHYQKNNIGEHEKFLKMINNVFSKSTEVFAYRLNRLLVLKG
jgi:spermidine synthase